MPHFDGTGDWYPLVALVLGFIAYVSFLFWKAGMMACYFAFPLVIGPLVAGMCLFPFAMRRKNDKSD
jgi:hypothetical protein